MANEKFKALMEDEEFVKRIENLKTDEEYEAVLKEKGLDLDDVEIETEEGSEDLTAEDLKEVAGGWQQFANLYNIPCNVCGTWYAAKTVAGAKRLLTLHTLTWGHRQNVKKYGYNRYDERPFWG